MRKLVDTFADLLPDFPDVAAVNLGGGIPHPYRPGAPRYDLAWFRPVLVDAAARLAKVAAAPDPRRDRAGALPGRRHGTARRRVKDLKATRANDRGPGHEFIMVDAGFNDLVRPAMYGSYHHISIVGQGLGQGAGRAPEPFVVAGPLCESGDVFTRDEHELLRAARAPAARSSAICWCCTTPAPTARR